MSSAIVKACNRLALAFALSAAAVSTSAVAETRIESVFADREAGLLFIDGKEFKQGLLGRQIPYVEIDGQPLELRPGYTDSHLEALLPVLPDGEYQVFVSRNCVRGLLCAITDPHLVLPDRRTSYSLSIPSALIGPEGPKGATGPIGATGAQGVQGLMGAQGPQGVTGPQGATGATGARGPGVSLERPAQPAQPEQLEHPGLPARVGLTPSMAPAASCLEAAARCRSRYRPVYMS